jgi:F-type H+-transporting ATPase subunit b
MELVGKIFETLEINQVALLQLGLVVVLAVLLSSVLIKPILRTFEERENRSVKPVEESRRLLAEAEEKARQYEETLRKSSIEALARKRRVMEDAVRAERKLVEAALSETTRKVEQMTAQITEEKESALASLRRQVASLSAEITEKVLGRRVA